MTHHKIMRFSRSSLFRLAFIAPNLTLAKAFTTTSNGRSLHRLHTLSRKTNILQNQSPSTLTSSSSTPRKSINMFFSNLFGSPTPSVIDYSTLDYPGNEMGKLAKENKVITSCEREPNLEAATFAGGCFWGFELAYQRVPGVVYTAVGYAQGPEENPTYSQVCSGGTGHTEAVCVLYDPKECSYENLLDTYFSRVDPTTANGQGNDRGKQYRTGVYYHTAEQEEKAKARFDIEKGNYRRAIASECTKAMPFWPAEKYHQQYLEKGGRGGKGQDASKGATDTIRCYG